MKKLQRECPNPSNNVRCNGTLNYKKPISYEKAIINNSLCCSCSVVKGQSTKQSTGNLLHSEETKQKIKNTLKKQFNSGELVIWNKGFTTATDSRIQPGIQRCGPDNPFYEKHHSDETIKKLKGPKSEEVKANMKHAAIEREKKYKLNGNHPNKDRKHTNETKKKIGIKSKLAQKLIQNNYKNNGIQHPNKDRKHTNETKRKISIGSVKCMQRRLEKMGGKKIRPFYNVNAIPIIELYGKEHGYNFQHAENGGEIHVLKYFVDGYDKDNNVVIEYDEKGHFTISDTLKQNDIIRQTELIQELNCKFIRIKYDGTITIIE